MSILPRRSDENTEPRARLFETTPTVTAHAESHWYVDAIDYPGYCAACGLPRANRRHAARPGAAA